MNRPRYLLCVSFFYHKLKTIEKHLTTIGNNWQLSKTIENRWNHRRQIVGHVIGWNHGCIFICIAIGWILLSDLPRPLLTLHAATLRLRYSCFVTLNKVGKTWWRWTFSHEASSGLPHWTLPFTLETAHLTAFIWRETFRDKDSPFLGAPCLFLFWGTYLGLRVIEKETYEHQPHFETNQPDNGDRCADYGDGNHDDDDDDLKFEPQPIKLLSPNINMNNTKARFIKEKPVVLLRTPCFTRIFAKTWECPGTVWGRWRSPLEELSGRILPGIICSGAPFYLLYIHLQQTR